MAVSLPRRRRLALPLAAALAAACGQTPPQSAVPPAAVAPAPEAPVAPSWEDTLLPVVKGHLQAGRLDSAIAACQVGLQFDSTRVVLYNFMASAYSSQGRYGPAIDALKTAVRLAPSFTVAFVNLGGIYTKLGQFAEAETYLARAAELDPLHSAVRRRLGELYLGTGRAALARQQFEQAMGILPGDATLTFFRGRAIEELGDAEEALASYLRAGALDPGYGEAHYRAATLARRLQRVALADSCLAIRAHMDSLATGDLQAQTTHKNLRGAVANAPEDAVHQARLGAFYLHHGYLAEALPLFARAAVLDPGNAWLLNEMGGMLSRAGQPREALAHYRRALQLHPQEVSVLLNVGSVLSMQQQHAEALPYFEQAFALAPQDPGVRFYLGVAQMNLGRKQEARAHLTQVYGVMDDANPLKKQVEELLQSLGG